MYKIIVDRSHALVKIEMEGMLSVAEADALVGDLIRQITEARLASYGLIIDVSRCPVQAQDMIATMGAHLAGMKNARALAVVTGTMLVRLQVRRIFDQPFTRFTATYDEARRWVLLGIEPGASVPGKGAEPVA
ncbi:hypothetical protein [Sphingomonas radiodurans]|uniref:hypothetical protein n=1 Tax=Sphingomonas radiodurans TaxID=2890321 RepID=UPI001E3F8279|nr:hypothetical protein [Sphingomonas radiodurans]WBH17454.1 hypothetical protein LLW23_04930 [Sphingomonas radiodurans]